MESCTSVYNLSIYFTLLNACLNRSEENLQGMKLIAVGFLPKEIKYNVYSLGLSTNNEELIVTVLFLRSRVTRIY